MGTAHAVSLDTIEVPPDEAWAGEKWDDEDWASGELSYDGVMLHLWPVVYRSNGDVGFKTDESGDSSEVDGRIKSRFLSPRYIVGPRQSPDRPILCRGVHVRPETLRTYIPKT